MLQGKVGQRIEEGTFRGCCQGFRINAGGVQQVAAAIGQTADFQLFASSGGNGVGIVQNHLNQGFAHGAVTSDEEVDVLDGTLVEELVVDGADGVIRLVGRDNDRDVPFR